jgi:copper(I)-binding protein
VAEKVEIHEIVEEDDVMSMRPIEGGLELPAGESTVLEPGGYHVMLIGLTADLNAGETYTLTLEFERAGMVEMQVAVATGNEAPAGDIAEPVEAGDLVISGVWSRAAPAMM